MQENPEPDAAERRAITLAAAKGWAAYFEALRVPGDLAGLAKLCNPEIRFKDPFNDVKGVESLRRIFEHMFETTVNPQFSVLGVAPDTGRDDRAYLHWRFVFHPKGRENEDLWVIEGMSVVLVDEAGLLTSHIDHWDSGEQFYERLPLVGALVRFIKGKMRAS